MLKNMRSLKEKYNLSQIWAGGAGTPTIENDCF